MDILAHTLWAYAAARGVNHILVKKNKKPLHPWLTAFFGVWPDIFAGVIPFAIIFWGFLSGTETPGFSRINLMEHGSPQTAYAFNLWNQLYHWSHSLVIFFLVFCFIYLILRRPVWELGGWLLHILIDIPTHSVQFFPTPFLWPFSEQYVNGISWGTPWFMVLNYSALLLVLIFLWRKKNHA